MPDVVFFDNLRLYALRQPEPFEEAAVSLETQPINLDEKKFALDAEMRRREMSLKEAEARKSGLSTAHASVAGAIVALVSGVIGASIAAWSNQKVESGKSLTSLQIEELKTKGNLDLEKSKQIATESLERKKFETSLILSAIKTPSRADAVRNLKFFVSAGFVSDPDGRISRLTDDSLPSIGAPSPESANRALSATGIVGTASQQICTGALISPRHIVTSRFCLRTSADRDSADQDSEALYFTIGEHRLPLRRIPKVGTSNLALLEITGPASPSTYLDRSRIREPVVGERVYLAVRLAGQEGVQLRTCEIVPGALVADDFAHTCTTGPGSAGAVVIAVNDDALLGVHHSAMRQGAVGLAARLTAVLAQLTLLLTTAAGGERPLDTLNLKCPC